MLGLLSLRGVHVKPQPALDGHSLALALFLAHLVVEVVHDLRYLVTALACRVCRSEDPHGTLPLRRDVLIPRLADAHKACGIVHHIVQEVLLHLVAVS